MSWITRLILSAVHESFPVPMYANYIKFIPFSMGDMLLWIRKSYGNLNMFCDNINFFKKLIRKKFYAHPVMHPNCFCTFIDAIHIFSIRELSISNLNRVNPFWNILKIFPEARGHSDTQIDKASHTQFSSLLEMLKNRCSHTKEFSSVNFSAKFWIIFSVNFCSSWKFNC